MQCNCGGSTVYHEHEVKTLEKAQEWLPWMLEEDLPVAILRDVCSACGRHHILNKPSGEIPLK